MADLIMALATSAAASVMEEWAAVSPMADLAAMAVEADTAAVDTVKRRRSLKLTDT